MHAHVYSLHKRRLRWNSHISPPPKLEPGKTWHGLSRNQGVAWTWWTVPNASKNLSEPRLEVKKMVYTITVIAKHQRLSSNIPKNLTRIVKWRNPSQRDDGRIQVRQMARHTVFGMIMNCVFVNSLQLQHTWKFKLLEILSFVIRHYAIGMQLVVVCN
jgi:hypothetical protein